MHATRLEDLELGGGVNIQIGQRIGHGIEMTGLTGQIEEKLATLDQGGHRLYVADVGQIDLNSIPNVVDVEEIPAVLRNKAVHEGNVGAQTDQAAGQVRPDKAESPGDEDVGAGETIVIRRHRAIVSRPKRFSITFRTFFGRIGPAEPKNLNGRGNNP